LIESVTPSEVAVLSKVEFVLTGLKMVELITVECVPFGFTIVEVLPLLITAECVPSGLTIVKVLPLLITIE
jgi:hypothetical protein